jgi:PPK2 family polyphosphate:nucleotide phosphotransferase
LEPSAFKLTRHCERSEAIHRGVTVGQPESQLRRHGLLRRFAPRDDERFEKSEGSWMSIDTQALQVAEGEKLSLEDRPTEVASLYDSKDAYSDALEKHTNELERLHERLYAFGRHAVLVVLQGMDTSGKDGAIAHVMRGVNPQGCRVTSFKTPTPIEWAHDFLWRVQSELPPRGAIAIFNRSYYEAVLIERVHPKFLASEGLAPPSDLDAFFDARYRAIREFERHLAASDMTIVKIFLHISKHEQKKRLLARLDDPEKNWKLSPNDIAERGYW